MTGEAIEFTINKATQEYKDFSRLDVSVVGIQELSDSESGESEDDMSNIGDLSESTINSKEDNIPVEPRFSPSLYQQRNDLVLDLLTEAGVTGILDMGCNNCKFLKILRGGVLPEVRLVAGLDIDKELLEDNVKYLRPLPGDWLDRREKPFTLELYHGSCGSENGAKVLSGRVQAVTAIELIEHLDPDTLNTFPSTVLGVLSPLVWIVTTPNREFNVLFPQFIGPFRHWDH